MIYRTKRSYILFLIFLISCGTKKADSPVQISNNKYATHFALNHENNLVHLSVINPWQEANNTVIDYWFSHSKSKVDSCIHIPVKRVICMSTTHIAFLDRLNTENLIVGVSGKQFIYNENIRTSEDVKDVGYDQTLNYEKIVALKPDVVLLYGIGEEITGVAKRLQALQIPVVIIAEYLESSPLARLEWIKVFGIMTGKEKLADSIFLDECYKYNRLKEKITDINYMPTVFTGLPYKDAWYITPGDNITNSFIKDAGGRHLWYNYDSLDVKVLDIESVLIKAENADFWLNTGNACSKDDILLVDNRLSLFKAFKSNNVYNNNKRLNVSGGNDYFESAVVQPDKVLEDLIRIFHPNLLPDDELYYFQKL